MAQAQEDEAPLLRDAKALLRRLDEGGELGREEVGRLVEAAEVVDELYRPGRTEVGGFVVEPLKMLVRRLPNALWLVTVCEDDSWRRVGELVLGLDFAVARNHSGPANTDRALTAGAEAARELAEALGVGVEDARYGCLALWVVGVRSEVLRCVGDAELHLIVAPHIAYSVRTVGGGRREHAVVRGADAVRALHVLLNTP